MTVIRNYYALRGFYFLWGEPPTENDVVRCDLTGTALYRWTEAFIFLGENPQDKMLVYTSASHLAYTMLGKIYPQRIKLCYQTTLPPLLYTNLLAS